MSINRSSIDSRSQIDILGNEDTTLLALSQEIDGHTSCLRKSVLEAVANIRTRIHQQAQEMIDGERLQSRENERRLLSQIDTLQHMLDQRTDELLSERALNERLVSMIQKQKSRQRAQQLAHGLLHSFHKKYSEQKRHERLSNHLLQVRKERETRSLFFTWRLEAADQKLKDTKEQLEGEFRRAIHKATTEHHSSENKMKLEMLTMKDQLQKEEERRAILEERLKSSFLKGVCEMNMEAMKALRDTNVAGETQDSSMASFMANMNMSPAGGYSDTSMSNQPGTTDRLFRTQAEVHEQLQRTINPEPEENIPVPMSVGLPQRKVSPTVNQQKGVTVTVNPNYPKRATNPPPMKQSHVNIRFPSR